MLPINVNVRKDSMDQHAKLAHNPDNGTLDQINAFVQHQKLSGMETNVFAIKTCSAINVSLVQPPEFGTSQRMIASVQLLKQFGLAQTVNVPPVFMEIIAFHAQHQDIGMPTKSNVFAKIL